MKGYRTKTGEFYEEIEGRPGEYYETLKGKITAEAWVSGNLSEDAGKLLGRNVIERYEFTTYKKAGKLTYVEGKVYDGNNEFLRDMKGYRTKTGEFYEEIENRPGEYYETLKGKIAAQAWVSGNLSKEAGELLDREVIERYEFSKYEKQGKLIYLEGKVFDRKDEWLRDMKGYKTIFGDSYELSEFPGLYYRTLSGKAFADVLIEAVSDESAGLMNEKDTILYFRRVGNWRYTIPAYLTVPKGMSKVSVEVYGEEIGKKAVHYRVTADWDGDNLTNIVQIAKYIYTVMNAQDYRKHSTVSIIVSARNHRNYKIEEFLKEEDKWSFNKTFYKLGKDTEERKIITEVCDKYPKFGGDKELAPQAEEDLRNAIFTNMLELGGEDIKIQPSQIKAILKRACKVRPKIIKGLTELCEEHGTPSQSERVKNLVGHEGEVAIYITIAYAVRGETKRVMEDLLQKLSVAKTFFRRAQYERIEKNILRDLENKLTTELVDMIYTRKGTKVTVESFVRSRIWGESYNLSKGPVADMGLFYKGLDVIMNACGRVQNVFKDKEFNKDTTDIWQNIIESYLRVYQAIVFEEYVIKKKVPQEWHSYMQILIGGVQAKLEAKGYTRLSGVIGSGDRTPLKISLGKENRTELSFHKRNKSISIPASMRNMRKGAFAVLLKTDNWDSVCVRVIAKDGQGRRMAFIVREEQAEWFNLPEVIKEGKWHFFSFAPACGDYRYYVEKGFMPEDVRDITLEMAPSEAGKQLDKKAKVIVQNPMIMDSSLTSQLSTEGTEDTLSSSKKQLSKETVKLKLTPATLVNPLPDDAKTERRKGIKEEDVDKPDDKVFYYYTRAPGETEYVSDQTPAYIPALKRLSRDFEGKNIIVEGKVPEQADKTKPIFITFRDINGFMMGKMIESKDWNKDFTFSVEITPETTPIFDASNSMLIELRFTYKSKKTPLGWGILGLLLGFILHFAGFALGKVLKYRKFRKTFPENTAVDEDGAQNLWPKVKGFFAFLNMYLFKYMFGKAKKETKETKEREKNLKQYKEKLITDLTGEIREKSADEIDLKIDEWKTLVNSGSIILDNNSTLNLIQKEKNKLLEEINRIRDEHAELEQALAVRDYEPEFNREYYHRGISEAAKSIRDWVDDMRVDFRQIRKQEDEDEPTFLPFMRFSEVWEFSDYLIFPKYPLSTITRGIGMMSIAGALYSLGFTGFLTTLYPILIVFMAGSLFNWRDVKDSTVWSTFFIINQMLFPYAGMAHSTVSIIFSALFISLYITSSFGRYFRAVKDPKKYVEKQKQKLQLLHSILYIMQNGDESLKRAALRLGDSNQKVKANDFLNMINDQRLDLSPHAKNFLKARAGWYKKEGLTKKSAKELLWTMATSNTTVMPKIQGLRRWARSHTIGKGAVSPGGDIEKIEPFGETLGSAIREMDELSAKPIPERSLKSFYVMFTGSVLLGTIFGGALYVLFGSIVPLVISVAGSFIVAGVIHAILIGRATRRLMLIDPARDMKKIFRENFRNIYNISTGRQIEATNVWRTLIEIRAALGRERDVLDGPQGISNLTSIIQSSLDWMRIVLTNVRDTAITRGVFDAFHLSKYEESKERIKILFKTFIGIVIISVLVQFVTFSAMYVLAELTSVITTGSFAAFSAVFKRPFAVVEILKAIFTTYTLQNPWRWVLFAFSQTFFATFVLGGIWLAEGKFIFYYLGDNAKLYPEEKIVTKKRVVTAVFTAFIGVSAALTPGISTMSVILRSLGVVVLSASIFRLFILRTARHRFKAIGEEDKLLEHDTPKPRERKLTDPEWETMKAGSFDAFRNLVMDRYDAEERDIIIKACNGTILTHQEKMLYERGLGKGSVPSGTHYNDFSLGAIEIAYEALDKEQIIHRMTGAGFTDLKQYLHDTRNMNIDEDLKLWHIQDEDEKNRFLSNIEDIARKNEIQQSINDIFSLSALELRVFLDRHTLEKRIIMMYDFLPKFTPWFVVVMGDEAMLKLVDYCVGYRYPLHKLKFIFAGENWDGKTDNYVQQGKMKSILPPQLVFRGCPVREDNLNKADLDRMSPEERKKATMAWVQATQPYTKPGANTSVLDASDGISGIIYDAENTPQPNQPLHFLLGVMDGVVKVRHLLTARFAPAIDTPGVENTIRQDDDTETIVDKSLRNVTQTLRRYQNDLTEEDISNHFRFNIKQKGILVRHLKYFVNHTLRTLLEVTDNLDIDNAKKLRLLSTGTLFETIRREIQKGRPAMDNKDVRELINLYMVLCNIPGYGKLATGFIKGGIDKDEFIRGLIKGEFRRINEPKNGQGRLGKITNALGADSANKSKGSQGQVSAFMYAEYASWYDPGWSGFHAAQDTFKPLGGTTGYFSTEAVEEIDWEDPEVQSKLLLHEEILDSDDQFILDDEGQGNLTYLKALKSHYKNKNKLLTIGAWDEFQVAEDFMLGMVSWWSGFNIAGFYSMTPEDPAGFESEFGYKFRPKQISRWIKGYIIGWVVLVERIRNAKDLYERKGLWGYIVFLVPTLSSVLNPLLFLVARFVTQFWWLYFVPFKLIFSWFAVIPVVGPYLQGFLIATQLKPMLLYFKTFIAAFVPDSLNFLTWAIGAPMVILPFVQHTYFTLRGIFRGVDNRLGIKRIIAEHEELLGVVEDKLFKEFEKGDITQKEYDDCHEEVERRLKMIKTGDITTTPGLVSPGPWVFVASVIVVACLTILFLPPIGSKLMTFLVGVSVTFIFAWISYEALMLGARRYINNASDEEERRIRAMIIRTAAPALFIAFYHGTIYLPGNVIAWSEVLSGGRTGYWWRTPRSTELIDQVKARYVKSEKQFTHFDKAGNKEKYLKKLSEKVWDKRETEFDLEQTRLWTRLAYGWGFIGAMLLLICYGFRVDAKDHFLSVAVNPIIDGAKGYTPTILQATLSQLGFAAIVAVGILGASGLVYFLVKKASRKQKYDKGTNNSQEKLSTAKRKVKLDVSMKLGGEKKDQIVYAVSNENKETILECPLEKKISPVKITVFIPMLPILTEELQGISRTDVISAVFSAAKETAAETKINTIVLILPAKDKEGISFCEKNKDMKKRASEDRDPLVAFKYRVSPSKPAKQKDKPKEEPYTITKNQSEDGKITGFTVLNDKKEIIAEIKESDGTFRLIEGDFANRNIYVELPATFKNLPKDVKENEIRKDLVQEAIKVAHGLKMDVRVALSVADSVGIDFCRRNKEELSLIGPTTAEDNNWICFDYEHKGETSNKDDSETVLNDEDKKSSDEETPFEIEETQSLKDMVSGFDKTLNKMEKRNGSKPTVQKRSKIKKDVHKVQDKKRENKEVGSEIISIQGVNIDLSKIKGFIFDLDDTLALLDQPILSSTNENLIKLLKRGKHIAIITLAKEEKLESRVWGQIPEELRRNLHIYSNGGTVEFGFNDKGEKTGYHRFVLKKKDRQDVLKIVDFVLNGKSYEIKPVNYKVKIELGHGIVKQRRKIIAAIEKELRAKGIDAKVCFQGKNHINVLKFGKSEAAKEFMSRCELVEENILIIANSARSFGMDRKLMTSFAKAISINVGSTSPTISLENPNIIQTEVKNLSATKLILDTITENLVDSKKLTKQAQPYAPPTKRQKEEKTPHAFKPISGFKAGLLTGALAVTTFCAAILRYLILGNFNWINIAAVVIGIYFSWATVRYFFIGRATYTALEEYYTAISDPRSTYEDEQVQPRRVNEGLTPKELLKIEIARRDGYRHPAFYELSPKVQNFINLHESMKNHLIGMLALLPFVSGIREAYLISKRDNVLFGAEDKAEKVLIEAHRGKVNSRTPENTLEAFRESAADSRVDLIELDIQLTKDEEFVVVHDHGHGIRGPTAGVNVLVKDLTASQVAQYNPHIPTLKAALEVIIPSGKMLNIDIKDFGRNASKDVDLIANKLVDTLGDDNVKGNIWDRVYAFSFNFDIIKKVKEIIPKIRVGYVGDKVQPCDETIEEDIRKTKELGASYISIPYENCTSFVLNEVQKSAIPLYVYAIGKLPELGEFEEKIKELSNSGLAIFSTEDGEVMDVAYDEIHSTYEEEQVPPRRWNSAGDELITATETFHKEDYTNQGVKVTALRVDTAETGIYFSLPTYTKNRGGMRREKIRAFRIIDGKKVYDNGTPDTMRDDLLTLGRHVERFKKEHPGNEVIGASGYGNLIMNDWIAAYTDGEVIKRDDEEEGRIYFSVVIFKNGKIEFRNVKYDGNKVIDSELKEDITGEVSQVMSGQAVVRDGKRVDPADISEEYYDVKHLLHLPFVGEERKFTVHFGMDQFLEDKQKLKEAVQGKPVTLKMKIYQAAQPEDEPELVDINIEKLKKALTEKGYREVNFSNEIEKRGQYFIDEKNRTVTMCFLPGIQGHHFIGMDKDGRFVDVCIEGKSNRMGINLEETGDWLIQKYGIRNAIMIDQSDDIMMDYKGAPVVRGYNNRQKIASAVIYYRQDPHSTYEVEPVPPRRWNGGDVLRGGLVLLAVGAGLGGLGLLVKIFGVRVMLMAGAAMLSLAAIEHMWRDYSVSIEEFDGFFDDINVALDGVTDVSDVKEIILKRFEEERRLIEEFSSALQGGYKNVEVVTPEFIEKYFENVSPIYVKTNKKKLCKDIFNLWKVTEAVRKKMEDGAVSDENICRFAVKKDVKGAGGSDYTEVYVALNEKVKGAFLQIYEQVESAGFKAAMDRENSIPSICDHIQLGIFRFRQKEKDEKGKYKDGDRLGITDDMINELVDGLKSMINVDSAGIDINAAWDKHSDVLNDIEFRLRQPHECESNGITGGVLDGVIFNLDEVDDGELSLSANSSDVVSQDEMALEKIHMKSIMEPEIYQKRGDENAPQANNRTSAVGRTFTDAICGMEHGVKKGLEGEGVNRRVAWLMNEYYGRVWKKRKTGDDSGACFRNMFRRIIRKADEGYKIPDEEKDAECEKLNLCYTKADDEDVFAKLETEEKDTAVRELAAFITRKAHDKIKSHNYTARFALWEWLENDAQDFWGQKALWKSDEQMKGKEALKNWLSGEETVQERISRAKRIINEITNEINREEGQISGINEMLEKARRENRQIVVVSKYMIRDEFNLKLLREKGIKYFVCAEGSMKEHVAIIATSTGATLLSGVPKIVLEKLAHMNGSCSIVAGVAKYDVNKAVFLAGKPMTKEAKEMTDDVKKAEYLKNYYGKREIEPRAKTEDLHEFSIYANINLPFHRETRGKTRGAVELVKEAYSKGAEGIALVRTEYVYNREYEPGLERQVKLYTAVSDVENNPVTFRTFDKRHDKRCNSLPNKDKDGQPFGYGFEYYKNNPAPFKLQLKALLLEYALSKYKNGKIMVPMVKSYDDIEFLKRSLDEVKEEILSDATLKNKDWFKKLLGARNYENVVTEEILNKMPIGIMVETKEVVEILKPLLHKYGWIKFISIGSNDLISALNDGKPREELKPEDYNKNVLKKMKEIVRIAGSAKREVSICGSDAADGKTIMLSLSLMLEETCRHTLIPGVIPALLPRLRAEIAFTSAMEVSEKVSKWSDLSIGAINEDVKNFTGERQKKIFAAIGKNLLKEDIEKSDFLTGTGALDPSKAKNILSPENKKDDLTKEEISEYKREVESRNKEIIEEYRAKGYVVKTYVIDDSTGVHERTAMAVVPFKKKYEVESFMILGGRTRKKPIDPKEEIYGIASEFTYFSEPEEINFFSFIPACDPGDIGAGRGSTYILAAKGENADEFMRELYNLNVQGETDLKIFMPREQGEKTPVEADERNTRIIEPYLNKDGIINTDMESKNFPKEGCAYPPDVGKDGKYRSSLKKEELREGLTGGEFTCFDIEPGTFKFKSVTQGDQVELESSLWRRAQDIENNKEFHEFLSKNYDLLKDLKVYLVESAKGDREELHPHLLMCRDKEWQIAFSRSREGRYPSVYLTRAFFEEMPIEIVLKVLYLQMVRAVYLRLYWNAHVGEKVYPFNAEYTPEIDTLIKSIRSSKIQKRIHPNGVIQIVDGAIQKEIDEVEKYETGIFAQSLGFEERLLNVCLKRINGKNREMDGQVAELIDLRDKIKLFQKSVQERDNDGVLMHWGSISVLRRILSKREDEIGKFIMAIGSSDEFKLLAEDINEVLAEHVKEFGIYNVNGGLNCGIAVGKLVLIRKLEDLEHYITRADKNDILVLPENMRERVNKLNIAGIIVSSRGKGHARRLACSECIPMAHIPDAVNILEPYGEKDIMFRVNADRIVRIRIAENHEIEKKEEYKRARSIDENKVRTVKASVGKGRKAMFDLRDVNMSHMNEVGPRAAHLGHMWNNGFEENIAEGVVLSSEFIRRILTHANRKTGQSIQGKIAGLMQGVRDETGALAIDRQELEKRLEKIRNSIITEMMPEELKNIILESAEKLKGRNNNKTFQVFPSFNFGDWTTVNTDGVYASYPNIDFSRVKTNKEIIEAVKRCIAQKYSYNAFMLRLDYRIRECDVYPAVILQVPVSEAASIAIPKSEDTGYKKRCGKIYTHDPLTNSKGMIYITGVWGIDAGSVKNGESPAEIMVNRFTEIVEVINKGTLYEKQVLKNGKLVTEKVTERGEILPAGLARRLVKFAKKVAAINNGWPYEIGWSVREDGKIYINYAKPIPEALPHTESAEMNLFDVFLFNQYLPAVTNSELKTLNRLRKKKNIEALFDEIKIFTEQSKFEFSQGGHEQIGQKIIALWYLEQLLHEKEMRDKVTKDMVDMLISIAGYRKNLVTQGQVFNILGRLNDTDDEQVKKIKDFFENLDLQKETVLGYCNLFSFAEAAARLGLYQKTVSALDVITENFIKRSDRTFTLSAKIMRIIDDYGITEAEPILVKLRKKFPNEWVFREAQILMNKIKVLDKENKKRIRLKVLIKYGLALWTPDAIFKAAKEKKVKLFLDKAVRKQLIPVKGSAKKYEITDIFRGSGKELKYVNDLVELDLDKEGELDLIIAGTNRNIDSFINDIMRMEDPTRAGIQVFDVEGIENVTYKTETEEICAVDFCEKYSIMAGVLPNIYGKLDSSMLEELKDKGVVVKELNGKSHEEMLTELENKKTGERVIACLLEIDPSAGKDEILKIINDLAEKVLKDIPKLIESKKTRLTKEDIERIKEIDTFTSDKVKDLQKGELKDCIQTLVKFFDEAKVLKSFKIAEKSLYDMKIDNIYRTHKVPYHSDTIEYVKNLKTKQPDSQNERYLVTAIDSALDMKMLAAAIKERRVNLDIRDAASDPIKDVLVVRNDMLAKQLKKALEFNGLAEYISEEEVIILEEGKQLSPEKVLNKIGQMTGKGIKAHQVAIATRKGIITLNTEISLTSGTRKIPEFLREDTKGNMLMVRMDIGLISQLYKKTVEIMANDNQIPTKGVRDGMLQKIAGYNVFIYFPDIKAINIDTEAEDYERYVREVLTRA